PGNVYSVTITGTAVAETKLNTTPTAGGNVAQLGIVGTDVWFTTQNAAGSDGILHRVPRAGGPAARVLDLSTLAGWNGLANGRCVVAGRIYIGSFDMGTSGAATGCLAVYAPTTSIGSVLRQLPRGKYVSGTETFNTGVVCMQGIGGRIHCL